jgi:hypothetical protein
LPFEADTPLAVVIKHINDPLPMPRAVNPEVPEPVERIILKAMAKNPDDRYQHVGDMLNDLKRAIGLALDETPTDTLQARALPAGATAASMGAVTPFPATARAAASAKAAPVSGPTVVGQKPKPAPKAGPTLLLIGGGLAAVVLIAVIVIGVIAASSARGTAGAAATQTAQAIAAAQQSSTVAPPMLPSPSATPTPANVVGAINANNVRLRQSPSESAADLGLLTQGTKLTVRQRTTDNAWLRVETADNILGWVSVKDIDLGKTPLSEIPQSTLLTVPTAAPNLAATAAACKPEAQVADVTVPDGSQVKPGEAFVKTWRFTSSGNCAWEKGATLVFQSGEKMDAPASVPVDSIEVGKSVEVSVNLKAPTAPGTYTGQWALQRPSGQVVAATDVSVVVPAPPTSTPAPQPTVVIVATARPAATATSASGGIPPIGSGVFAADQSASGPWNCVRVSDNEWAGEFFISVSGGPGNYTINDTANCRWDYGQQKFTCRFVSRYDGSVNALVQVSCPGCRPLPVNITGRAVTGGKDLPVGVCKAN